MEPRGGKRTVFTAAVIMGLTVPRRLFLAVVSDRLIHFVIHQPIWRGGLLDGNGYG